MKFIFGPKCDVWKVRCSDILCSECSKFGILVFILRLLSTQVSIRITKQNGTYIEKSPVWQSSGFPLEVYYSWQSNEEVGMKKVNTTAVESLKGPKGDF